MVDDDTRDRQLLGWLGAGLLAGGMPVHEVEEDLREVAAALGHQRPQVACSPTGLWVALRTGETASFEQVDGGLRLDQLADVQGLQSALRFGRISPDAALAQLATLRGQPHRYRTAGFILGGMLSGVGIALILAPSLSSLVFAICVAPLAPAFLLLGSRGRATRTLTPFLAAFVVALAAFLAASNGLLDSPLRSLVAPIAVLLPGALIVTGLTELAAGSMVAGSSRLTFGLVQLLLFVLGVGAAFALVDGDTGLLATSTPTGFGAWAPLVGLLLVTLGIALLESVPLRQGLWLTIVLVATFAAQSITLATVDARWAGAFIGAAVASLLATLLEYLRPELPRMVAFLPSFWLLVPGSLGLISLAQFEVGAGAAALAVVDVVVVVAAVALGVIVGAAFAAPLRHVARRLGLPHLRRLIAQRRRRRRTAT